MKKFIFICLFLLIIFYSFIFPETIVEAAKNGICTWFNQILPALLPFTILSAILVRSDFLKSFKKNGTTIAILLTMICGFIFGFPIGAKLSADFYREDLLTKKQGTLLSITTNNFSPLFVCGFALPILFTSNCYKNITYILLYLCPLLIATCILLITSCHPITNGSATNDSYKKTTSRFHLNMQIMDASIISGFESLIKICGYIVIFSILSAILSNLWNHPPYIWTFVLENLEITNGITRLSQSNLSADTKYVAAIQLLSFGGVSGIAQTCSMLANSGLSTYKYIIGKALLSLLLTFCSVTYVFIVR